MHSHGVLHGGHIVPKIALAWHYYGRKEETIYNTCIINSDVLNIKYAVNILLNVFVIYSR